MVFPAIVAGSIFTFSLSLGDYIAVRIVGGANQMLGNVVYDNVGAANNLPFAAAVATIPVVIMLVYLAAVRRTGALDNSGERPDDDLAGVPHRAADLDACSRCCVIYVPLLLVVLNSFNASQTFAWPPTDLTLEWWRRAADSSGRAGRAVAQRPGRRCWPRRSRWCSARWPRSRCSATASSAATPSRC